MPKPGSSPKSLTACSLKVVKQGRIYLVLGDTPDGPLEMGDYETREEATEDMLGIVDFYLHQDEPGYVTSEPVIRKPKPVAKPEPPPLPTDDDFGPSLLS